MDTVPETYYLEDINLHHGIAAGLFVPFAIARLRRDVDVSLSSVLTVRIRGLTDEGEVQKRLRLSWSGESIPTQPLGVQQNTITEWAALAVACAVVFRYGGLQIRSVAAQGDRFDYWVTDGKSDYGLEVSGTMTEEVETRHQEKVSQLRDNPYQTDGYVVVVGFATRTVIFSFNRFAEKPG
jgi:hypothetical protein